MPINIAGNSDVRIQFIYDGTVLYNTSYNGYYFWMIDDIELVETPDHLLKLSDETFGGWWVGYQSTGDLGVDYTFNPINQATANPYRFEAVVSNNGASSQSNVTMHVEVDNFGSNVFSTYSNPMNIAVMSTDTLTTSTFAPLSTGYHQINYWVESDSFPSTDTIGRGTVVTDTIYAVDVDWDSDGSTAGNGYFLGRSCGGQVLGNAFDIYEDDEATSISFHVNDQSVAGAEVNIELYEIDAMVTPYAPIYLGESDLYTLTQSDIGNWVTISLPDPIDLYASITYIAAVAGVANPIDTSLISSSDNDNTLSFVQDNGCDIGSGGFGYWYSNSKPLMIRLNLGYEIVSSLEDNIFDGKLSVHPNPSKGIFNLDLVEVNSGEYVISVTNILGEVVYFDTRNVNNNSSTKLDLSNLNNGIYMLNVQNENSNINKKLIIE
jgi:hypothetical protein